MRRFAVLLAVLLSVAGGCATDAYPPLRILVPSNAGGGYDVTARIAAELLDSEGIVDHPEVFNVAGGGGAVGLTRMVQESGNSDLLMLMGLGVVAASITGNSPARVTRVVPIARLITEPEVVLVRAASPYRTLDELVADWRLRGAGLRIGGGSIPGGTDNLMLLQLARAAGIPATDVGYVPHEGGGQLLPALLDGSIDAAVSGPREVLEQVRSGQLRVLATSGTQRLSSVDAPTLREAGYDVAFTNWRGVVAPPGIPQATRQRFVALFTNLHSSPGWQQQLAENGWQDAFLTGTEFGDFLTDQDAAVRRELQELGLA
ncbi:tripartite tricarboxylate transporter substrate binding protein [Nakamurella flava]|uniref:Tripartite tricarboxylate transporter substrate binding protein n=2 Tax=Nakamurella flava TaxID=2576308 RepID=A0A4V6CSY4_9ACTN|nr:tripartite tricarboxylate transporter substrate binding protein [Nakamurella flava]